MALTESNMLALGTEAPYFSLLDVVSGTKKNIDDLASDVATVVMFWCNHCPYVIHVTDEVIALAREYQSKGISFVAISSNDVEKYPQDGPDKMKDLALEKEYMADHLKIFARWLATRKRYSLIWRGSAHSTGYNFES